MRRRVGVLAVAIVALAATLAASGAHTPAGAAATPWKMPAVRHVFVVNLENKGYTSTFADNSPAPYLAKTLPPQGAFLRRHGCRLAQGFYFSLPVEPAEVEELARCPFGPSHDEAR